MGNNGVPTYMMIAALSKKGYNGFALSVPSLDELLQIFTLAAPLFLTMMSKVAFYSFLVYYATSMGTHTAAAHQVMLQLFCIFAVWDILKDEHCESGPDAAEVPFDHWSIKWINTGIFWSVNIMVFPKMFSPDPLVIQETQVLVALRRLTLADGILYLEDSVHDELQKLKAA